MKNLVFTFLVLFFSIISYSQNELYISEYVQGDGNNRAIELYNPTSADIDLGAGNYNLVRYSNGGTTPYTADLTGIVPAGGTYVIVSDKRDTLGTGYDTMVDPALQLLADTFISPVYNTNKMMYFNGNDAVTLEKNGNYIDIIGRIGQDPGEAWTADSANGYTSVAGAPWWTKQHTLIRKANINTGVTTNPTQFNPAAEWDSLPNNYFGNLGTRYYTAITGPFSKLNGLNIVGINFGTAVWGDYDNDGDLDVLASGSSSNGRVTKIYKNNGNNTFDEQTSIILESLSSSAAAWGDYNNDGYLDIILTGRNSSNVPSTKLYRNNGDNTFSEETNVNLPGFLGSNIAWGDYDNDGDLDIVIAGVLANNLSATLIFTNNGSSPNGWVFSRNKSIMMYGGVDWGDYDNDGDLDLIIVGNTETKIYKNNGAIVDGWDFTEENNINIQGVCCAVPSWGDYDNDGDLDILIVGAETNVYKNEGAATPNGWNFVKQTSYALKGVRHCDGNWGDYDNDGYLDILLSGDDNSFNRISVIYKNNGVGGGFTEQTSISIDGLNYCSAVWGDYDNDGDLDILMTGRIYSNYTPTTNIYRNNTTTVNNAPNTPTGLLSQIVNDKIVLSWNKATDDSTSSDGLYYNVMIGSGIDSVDVRSPQSDISTGFHRVAEMGMIKDTFAIIEPQIGVTNCSYLYWKVQAIDAGLLASSFSTADSILNPLALETHNVDMILFDTTQITVNTNSCANPTYAWSPINSLDNYNVQSPNAFPPYTTTYTVTVTDGASVKTATVVVKVNNFKPIDDIAFTDVEAGDAEWGDYDNDGDLDILLIGDSDNGYIAKIYENDNSQFIEQTSISLTGVKTGDAAWGDYNNDGRLDIVITGEVSDGSITKVYRNDGPSGSDWSFSEQTNIQIVGMNWGTADWGDYDNDGDLDLLFSGFVDGPLKVAKIYENKGDSASIWNFEEQIAIPLMGVQNGSVIWGDYNNDGFLDILLTGENASGYMFKLYKNNGFNNGTSWSFIEDPNIYEIGVKGDAAWADFDNDGDLDFVITGNNNDASFAKIFENIGPSSVNSGWQFNEKMSFSTDGYSFNNVEIADYDNNGYSDILLLGGGSSKLIMNNSTSSFWVFDENASSSITNNNNDASVSSGDYNNDGIMDIIVTGSADEIKTTKIYQNMFQTQNSIPTAPSGLTSQITSDGRIQLMWNKATDANNASDGLSYNIRIGSSFGAEDIRSSQSDLTNGYHRIQEMGLTKDTFIVISLPTSISSCSTVYWAVQAIDANYTGSAFSTESSFTNILHVDAEGEKTIAINESAQLSATNNACAMATYSWSPAVSLSGSTVQSPLATPNVSTMYYVTVTEGSNTAIDSVMIYVDLYQQDTSIHLDGSYGGRTSWIDYDNDNDLDILVVGRKYGKLYKNEGNNTFTEQTSTIIGKHYWADLAIGDYNNDGYLDFVVVGSVTTLCKNNGDSTGFTEQTEIKLRGAYSGTADWGDYDNDGDLDLLISGRDSLNEYHTSLYKNNGADTSGTWDFELQSNINLPSLYFGDCVFADYDNDGDLDIMLAGNVSGNGFITKIYSNDGPNFNSFTERTEFDLLGAYGAAIAWGDYNNDGYIDFAYTGDDSTANYFTHIYKNNGAMGGFTKQEDIFIDGTWRGSLEWGDYDNDGDLDLLISGEEDNNWDGITKIYENNGNNSFSEVMGSSLDGFIYGNAIWGDYDNDGDLDILATGALDPLNTFVQTTRVYTNKLIDNLSPQANTAPTAPTNLEFENNEGVLLLTWNKSTDTTTPSHTLSYNLRVGSSLNDVDVNSPMSDLATGFHRRFEFGSIQDTFCYIKIPDTLSSNMLYWSVQAIDNGYLASEFSLIDSVSTKSIVSFTASQTSFTAPPFDVVFTNTSEGNYNTWAWNFGDGDMSSLENPTHSYLYNGNYTVTLFATDTASNITDTATTLISCSGGTNNPCTFTAELTQAQSSAVICEGDSFRLSATPMQNITYQWVLNGVIIQGATDSIFYAKDQGFYMAVLSNTSCSQVTNNYFALAKYTALKPIVSVIGSIAPCSNDSLLLEATNGFSSYVWSNGKTGRSIYTSISGYFSVDAYDNNTCKNVSDVTIINTALADIPNICVVTVDPITNNNMVKWQTEVTDKIDSYNVYKETTIANEYLKIGTVAYGANLELMDPSSDVSVRQYRYKIAAVDTCGKETPVSYAHTTLHLMVNVAPNDHWNLIWRPYEGFNFGSYNIYRGTDSTNMTLLTTVSSNLTSYTDFTNPTGNVYYQIEVTSVDPCGAKGFGISRSNNFNTKFADGVGINIRKAEDFNAMIYPNPNNGQFTLRVQADKSYKLDVEIFNSLGELVYTDNITTETYSQYKINLQQFSRGVYSIRLMGKDGLYYYSKIVIQ